MGSEKKDTLARVGVVVAIVISVVGAGLQVRGCVVDQERRASEEDRERARLSVKFTGPIREETGFKIGFRIDSTGKRDARLMRYTMLSTKLEEEAECFGKSRDHFHPLEPGDFIAVREVMVRTSDEKPRIFGVEAIYQDALTKEIHKTFEYGKVAGDAPLSALEAHELEYLENCTSKDVWTLLENY